MILVVVHLLRTYRVGCVVFTRRVRAENGQGRLSRQVDQIRRCKYGSARSFMIAGKQNATTKAPESLVPIGSCNRLLIRVF